MINEIYNHKSRKKNFFTPKLEIFRTNNISAHNFEE